VKTETLSFYESAVERALQHVVTHLDEALDLSHLARVAALSPFHFHRIFRGMLGETPLELHRRLRLERAALRLRSEETTVTTIALAAGYDTHEAWARLMGQWLPRCNERLGEGVTYEIYVNTPMEVPKEQLATELYLPLAPA
jgi:AraC family transcriptional regulator